MINVFVSSTVVDLQSYRNAVIDTVLDCKMHPVDMEHGRAQSASPVDFSLAMVEQANVYVGFFAHRYGDCPSGHDMSITEIEYRRAIERGIPRLIFLIDDNHAVRPDHYDVDPDKVQRLKALKAELKCEQTVGFFTDIFSLRYQVLRALVGLKEDMASGTARWRPPWLSEGDADPSSDRNQQLQAIEDQLAMLGLEYEAIRRLYWQSLPGDLALHDDWELQRGISKKATLHRALIRLADVQTQHNGIAPMLEFAERAAKEHPSACEAIRTCVNTALEAWGLASAPIEALRLELEREQSRLLALQTTGMQASPVYLLIALDPAEAGIETFFPQAWLFCGKSEQVCLYASDEPHSFDALPTLVKGLLNRVGRNRAVDPEAMANLAIEFLVPCAYFSRGVDHIAVDGVSLELEYRVVLRSLERIRNPAWHPRWKAKWKRIGAPFPVDSTSHVRWIGNHRQHGPRSVFADLVEEQVLCLGFTVVPQISKFPCDDHDTLHLALHAGTPVILWPRYRENSPTSARQVVTPIKELLSRQMLPELPDHLLNMRRDAARREGAHHVGQGLSLLWDDPTHVPPDAEEDALLEEPVIRR